MPSSRRQFLHTLSTWGSVALVLSSTLLKTGRAWAAWNQVAFGTKTVSDAMHAAGYGGAVVSPDIQLTAPGVAENGAAVAIEATSHVPGTTAMAIFVDKNPNPLVAEFVFSAGAEPYIAIRVKMAEASTVRVAIKAGDKVWFARRDVTLAAGGCGS